MDELQHPEPSTEAAETPPTDARPQPDPDNAIMVNATICLAVECPKCHAKSLAIAQPQVQAAIFGQRFLGVCGCGATHAVGLGGVLVIPMQAPPQQNRVVRAPKSNREFLQMIKDRG